MPKPVLSDSLFNASDVAENIISVVNLQIANSALAVTDRSGNISVASGYTGNLVQAFSFNGFMFISGNFYKLSTPGSPETIFSINDGNFHPIAETVASGVSHQGDTAELLSIKTNGNFDVANPYNAGSGSWHVSINFTYRFA